MPKAMEMRLSAMREDGDPLVPSTGRTLKEDKMLRPGNSKLLIADVR